MNTNFSILQHFQDGDIYHEPFPHIIIKDALPTVLAEILTNNFPISDSKNISSNRRFDISACDSDQHHSLIPEWKDFIAFHTSKEFFSQVLDIFAPIILRQNPYHFSSLQELSDLKVGTRYIDSFKEKDILLDTQLSINSPVTTKSSVRQAHTDNTNKLFSGLFYLRQPNDDSIGGNLNICSWDKSYSYEQKLKLYQEGLSSRHFSIFKEIEYKNNVCVFFLNSIDALHAVTPREVTPHHRTFVNFVGELKHDIFDHHPYFKRQFFRLLKFLRHQKDSLKQTLR
jgi:hypothetical protein